MVNLRYHNSLSTFISLILLFIVIPVEAQRGLLKTESDYYVEILHLDSSYEGHSYKQIDDEIIRIKYDCFLAFEDNIREGLREEMILQVGTNYSKFCSPTLHAADSAMIKGNDILKFSLFKKANPIFVFYCFYTDLSSGKLTFNERLVTEDFEYTETPPEIEWEIGEGVRQICGHLCQEATGKFRGRIYNVWFTEEIPVSIGPWKLRGLPGAILAASDSDGLCRFEATAIHDGNGIIEKPDYQYIKVSRKDYQALLKQYIKSPGGFISRHLSNLDAEIRITKKSAPLRGFVFLENDTNE